MQTAVDIRNNTVTATPNPINKATTLPSARAWAAPARSFTQGFSANASTTWNNGGIPGQLHEPEHRRGWNHMARRPPDTLFSQRPHPVKSLCLRLARGGVEASVRGNPAGSKAGHPGQRGKSVPQPAQAVTASLVKCRALNQESWTDRLCRACPLVGDGTYRRASLPYAWRDLWSRRPARLYLGQADGNRVQVDTTPVARWFMAPPRPMTGSLPRKSRPRAATRTPASAPCRSH